MDNSLRKRILTHVSLALALTGVVWGIAYWSVEEERNRRLTESAEQARRLAVFFESQTLSIFRYGDSFLKMVRRKYSRSGELDEVQALMQDVPLDRTIVSHITILDPQGTPVFNSGYAIKPGSTAKDRDYFIHQEDAADDELYVSLPHRGRNSGKLIVRLVRRITRPDSSFGGVIFAALEAKSITEFFLAMSLGPKSSATLVGLDKRIRARSSYGRLGPGQDISGSRIWLELEQSPVGLYKQTSVVDQITRYYAYRRLSEFPLIVAIGVATEDISLALSGFQLPAYLVACLATILIAAVTVLFSREILASQKIRVSEARVRGMHDELERRVEERTAKLKAVQQELLRKERLAVLGQLTGTVAHELRNPLSTITASVAVMERKLGESSGDLDATIARVRRSVDRCNNIITELLDFTRAKGLDPQPTELDPWLSELLSELHHSAKVAIQPSLNASGAVVAFDRDRLRRAVINLVDNARDAVAGDGEVGRADVQVTTRLGPERAEIEIADNGPGISEELMAKIHEPLFSTKSFGVGLGLPVVNRVMEEHGGDFEITSEEGQGTRALLWLPLAEPKGD